MPDGVGDSVEFVIEPATRDKLAALSREIGVTEFMLLQAAVAVVLHKAGAGSDIPIGTPVAGRTEAQLEQLVGFFVNFVVLRNDLHGNPSLRQVLLRARETALAAYANQDLPFDQVVDVVNPVRSLSRNPVFQVVVHVRETLREGVIDSGPDGATTFAPLEPTFDVAHTDLSVNFFASEDVYRGDVIYRPELYERATVQRFVGWLGRVIDTFAETPDRVLDDIEIGDAEEMRHIVDDWSRRDAKVHLLDAALRPVPFGVVGDIHIAGGPFAGDRWNTGTQGRWIRDGQIEVVARVEQHATARTREATTSAGPGEPPSTDTERALAAMLVDLLGVAEVSRRHDFFGLGGDSIMAVQLAARARDAGIDLTPRMVFEHPAVADLAAVLDDADGESDTGAGDIHHAPMTASGLSSDELAVLTSSWQTSQDGAP